MALTSSLQVFLAGLLGGLLLEFMHWYGLRRDLRFPAYAGKIQYWALSAVMALAGGGLALLYFGGRADGIVAVHVGISAPIILQKLTATAFEPSGAKGEGEFWSFLHW